MTLAELKQVNGLANQQRIVAGQPLLVPLKDGADESAASRPAGDTGVAAEGAPGGEERRAVEASTCSAAAARRPCTKAASARRDQQGRSSRRAAARAERGKRVKVVAKPAATKTQPSSKVAGRVAIRVAG